MKLILITLAITLAILAIPVKAQSTTTMVCQTSSGVQFVWVGTACPVGSYFVSY